MTRTITESELKTAREAAFMIARHYGMAGMDAEDAAQEAVIRIYRGYGSYDPDRPFVLWANTVSANVCIDILRRNRLRSRISGCSLDAYANDNEQSIIHVIPDPRLRADRVLDEVFSEEVARALALLPSHFRKAMLLVDVDGLTYEDCTERLNLRAGTLRSRLHRARKQMRENLQR